MKKLYQCLTALLWTLCLGTCTMADILPEPQTEPAKTGSPLTTILIIAVAVIAVAVLIVVLRRRRR